MINKKTALTWAIVLVLLTSMATFVISNTVTLSMGDKVLVSKNDYATLQSLDKLLAMKKVIKDYYVDGAKDDKLVEGAIKGMFEALDDPYSVYMTPEEYKNFDESTRGEYGGIGVIVSRSDEGYITVVAPIEDTPGERAGLKTNDKIVKVGDKDIIGMDLEAAVAMLKGKPGTQVQISIIRDKEKEPRNINIKREQIILKSVKSKMLENNIGYIRISMFDEDTGGEFKKNLDNLKKENMKGLVLDLRQNPGGFVTQCLKVADELLDKGLVVYTVDQQKKREDYYSKEGKLDVPFVILIDEGSASASEIVSGAVKDRKAGLLIGTKSFGKGLVQTSQELQDGSGFKLTTQKYYTPNGISINKKGIQPDIEIKALEPKEGQNPEEIKDVQLDKALEVLKNEMK